MTVPAGVADLGIVAVALFLFVAAGWIAMKIIQTLRGKDKQPASEVVNGNGKKQTTCIQSPQLQLITTTQARMMDAVRKMEEGGEELKENMVVQTKLMETMGRVLEKLSDFAVRREARFDVLERLIREQRGGSKE